MSIWLAFRSWWQRVSGDEETPLDGDTPAWMVSMVIHVAVLLGLSLYVVTQERERVVPLVINQLAHEEPLDHDPPVKIETVISEVGKDDPDDQPIVPDVPPAPVAAPSPESAGMEDVENSRLTPIDPVESLTGKGLITPIEYGGERDSVSVPVRNAGDALNFLAAVIRDSVVHRPTVVCWVFDQSVSLAGQRKDIADRLANVFAKLELQLKEVVDPDLEHMVFAYGEKVTHFLPQSTREPQEVVRSILAIPVDESGIENTFAAIHVAVETTAKPKFSGDRRNVLVIVFTDEVGNDQDQADKVSAVCQNLAVPVYVVGVPAPFGRMKVPMRFVEYDTTRFNGGEQWAEVDQGPESLFPEFVRIRFGPHQEDEPMDSGFGPFSLSKLCSQTGGRYLCVHANRKTDGPVNRNETAPMASWLQHFFTSEAMREYRPLYVSSQRMRADIERNPAKMALVTAAKSEVVLEAMRNQRWVFPKVGESDFKSLLDEAQKAVVALEPRVEWLLKTLEAGRPGRAAIQEKRWQAGYDLALGQALAAAVRLKAYNRILGTAKQGMRFENPANDTWKLIPSSDFKGVGSENEKLANKARELLEKVVMEHQGTPWALIADRELKTPMGYAWEEAFTNVVPPKPAMGAGNAPRPADDAARRKLAPPKPPRPLKNL